MGDAPFQRAGRQPVNITMHGGGCDRIVHQKTGANKPVDEVIGVVPIGQVSDAAPSSKNDVLDVCGSVNVRSTRSPDPSVGMKVPRLKLMPKNSA